MNDLTSVCHSRFHNDRPDSEKFTHADLFIPQTSLVYFWNSWRAFVWLAQQLGLSLSSASAARRSLEPPRHPNASVAGNRRHMPESVKQKWVTTLEQVKVSWITIYNWTDMLVVQRHEYTCKRVSYIRRLHSLSLCIMGNRMEDDHVNFSLISWKYS